MGFDLFKNKEREDKEFVVSEDVATEEFFNFISSWEIKLKPKTADEKIDIEDLQEKIIDAIRRGRLVFNEDSTLTYTISKTPKKNGDKIIIKRPVGSTYWEADRYDDKQGIKKGDSILAAMTGHDIRYFADIDGIDLKPIKAVMTLFLAG